MTGAWLTLDEIRALPTVVVAIPLATAEFPAIGYVVTMALRDRQVWHVHADSAIDPARLTRLLAVLIINDSEPILPGIMMPEATPSAFLLKNDQFRTTRGFLFAPWVLNEIERLSGVLISEHSDYVMDLLRALRQESSGRFRRLANRDEFTHVDLPSARIGDPPPELTVRTETSERVRYNLTQHQLQAQDYVRNRYMILLSEDQLARRTVDIIGNMHVIDENGLVSLDGNDPYLSYWADRLTELQVEMQLRHGPYPAGWDQRRIDLARLPRSTAVSGTELAKVELRTGRDLGPDSVVKYGKLKYLRAMLIEGHMRFAPASLYADPTLNEAVRDNELENEIWCDPSVPFNEHPPGTIVFPTGRASYRAQAHSDYYVQCYSQALTTRLLLDFDADACLVIYDREEFLRRIGSALPREVAQWRRLAVEVGYYDPLQVQPTEVSVFSSKHFRYAYQREYRVALISNTVQDRLPFLELRIGSLEDIAELLQPTPRESA
jgi:hypothetical protein